MKSRVLLFGLVWCAGCSLFFGQNATLSGSVRDSSGAVIPGATLVLTNTETGSSRTLDASAGGRYNFPSLTPGTYELRVEKSGFTSELRGPFRLTVGQTATADIVLQVGQVTETITITGEMPLIDTMTGNVGYLVDEVRMAELPLNGRDYTQLAILQPGVVSHRATAPANVSGTSKAGGKIAVGGMTPLDVGYFFDGTDINSYVVQQAPGNVGGGATLGVGSIREFRVWTNNYSAEYGTKAGRVDLASKGGTDTFHGELFYFHRNDNLDARDFFDPFDKPQPEFRRHQYGLAAGGPIRPGKLLGFFNYEGLRTLEGATPVAFVPDLNARNGILPSGSVGVHPAVRGVLNLYPLPDPNSPVLGGGIAQWTGRGGDPIHEDWFTGRIDYNMTANDPFFVRYTLDRSAAVRSFSQTTVPGFDATYSGRDQFITAHYVHLFSPTLLNTFRAGFNRQFKLSDGSDFGKEFSVGLIPNSRLGGISVGGLASLGNGRIDNKFAQNVFDYSDTLNIETGRHSIRIGAEFKRIQLNVFQNINWHGNMSFPSLERFLGNRPQSYTAVLPNPDAVRGMRTTAYAFYIQDDFAVRSNLSLNLGLRYEPWANITEVNGKSVVLDWSVTATPRDFRTGEPIFSDNRSVKNIAPRIGLAWDPTGRGKVSLRGGFGMFYSVFPHQQVNNTQLQGPPFVVPVGLTNPPSGFPNPTVGVDLTRSVSALLFDRKADWPYFLQWNIGVQTQLAANSALTIAYAASRGVHLHSENQINTAIPSSIAADGSKFFAPGLRRRNTSFDNVTMFLNDGRSWYDSLQMNFTKRYEGGLTWVASYTFSKLLNTSDGGGGFVATNGPVTRMDADDINRHKGPAGYDIPHTFVANALWDLPMGRGTPGAIGAVFGGWQLGGILTLTSGLHYSVVNTFNRPQDLNVFVRNFPNLKPNADNNPKLGKVDQWFDPSSFELQRAGTYGNLGRNTLVGPGFSVLDFSLAKKFPIKEDVAIQFRAEFFNAINHPNFATPSSNLTGSSQGAPLFTGATGVPNLSATKLIKTVSASRQIQFSLRLNW